MTDGKNFTVRPPFQVSFLAKASSLPPLPSPPLFSDRKPSKRRWQRREKPAKTADVTGDVSCHRELRRRLEQKLSDCKTEVVGLVGPVDPNWKVLRPRIRSRRDPLRVKQRGTTCEWTLFSNLMHVWSAISTTLCTSLDLELGYGDLRYLELSEPEASLTGCCCRPLIG
ncbi:Malectin/receptor-like protein kinase family protein [Prunus dulcis]|uniref:Malectin/receptor-like protein kinase family protein n=1 Tax=Prunus dulcis TaxID=3755 RepID=A0A4Y1RAI7_PRUDU|nr:Malectin/receptor-like protein kinase family protein [Prunus dulcis]